MTQEDRRNAIALVLVAIACCWLVPTIPAAIDFLQTRIHQDFQE